MAVDKLVDSGQLNSDLEDIADAIRAKGGTSAQLAFPNGFVSAIENIPSGGGGLVYETGTYTPASDAAQPTISFANTHTTLPMYCMMADTTGTYSSTTQTNYIWTFDDNYGLFGKGFMYDSSVTRYANVFYMYRGSNSTSMSMASASITDPNISSSTNSTKYGYYMTTSSFKPYTGSTTRYWRSGRTYKWIAVWAPTT